MTSMDVGWGSTLSKKVAFRSSWPLVPFDPNLRILEIMIIIQLYVPINALDHGLSCGNHAYRCVVQR